MLDPTKLIRAAILTARRLPEPRISSRMPDQNFAKGGQTPKVKASKKKKPEPQVVDSQPASNVEVEEFGWHPAHKIPGIHIVTAHTGEPIFHGDE